MHATRLPVNLLREHAHARLVLLPHEEPRTMDYIALVDDCMAEVHQGDGQPLAMEWLAARSMAALLWRAEREILNGASVQREQLEASTNPDRRRRELAETTERRAVVDELKATAAAVREMLEAFRGTLPKADRGHLRVVR